LLSAPLSLFVNVLSESIDQVLVPQDHYINIKLSRNEAGTSHDHSSGLQVKIQNAS